MEIKELSLQNFRNHAKRSFEFSLGTTLIVGPNTSGKTNILEAICLLSYGKSLRADHDKDMISWNEEVGRVKAEVRYSDRSVALEVALSMSQIPGQRVSKRFLANGVFKRMVDFAGNLSTVIFSPEDIELVTDSPSVRRRYLDSVLSLANKEYRRAVLVYEKGLRQRNRLLERIRDENYDVRIMNQEMEYWDRLLIENGRHISKIRKEFIEYLNNNEHVEHKIPLLSGLNIYYDSSEISTERLDKYEREEISAGATLVGPHRDDFRIFDKKRDIHVFGSRGEQRLAVLWLKLGELEYLSGGDYGEAVGISERPVLLLDDIFSELDHEHRHMVLDVMPRQQTIITVTDLHLVEKGYLERVEKIEL